MRSERWACVLVGLLWLLPGRALATDGLSPERQAMILVRALAYDRGLRERGLTERGAPERAAQAGARPPGTEAPAAGAGQAIWVGVLSRPDDEGKAAADALLAGLRTIESMRVQGRALRALRLLWGGPDDLRARVQRHRLAVLYVAPGLDAEVAAIARVCRQAGVLSIGGQPSYVRGGLALGAFFVNSRNTIIINLPASRAEGADFDAELLRLAEVVR